MSYDPSQPTVYFDIGESIATIAILLMFISLANPTRTFRWKLSWWFRWWDAYILFFLGIVFVLIAAVLPVLPFQFQLANFARYPILWEVFACLAFVFGSLGLILCGLRPVRFTRRNCRSFFQECYSIIGEGVDTKMNALAEEISASAENMVDICKEYNQITSYFADKEGKSYAISEPVRWACSIFDLWSDKRFCNAIVTRCPETAITYLLEIQKKCLYQSGGHAFVKQLIAEAFRDPNSILHREERYSGLGHFLPFTETVFGNYGFIESNFRPLQAAGSSHDNLRNIEKYNQCFLRTIRAYLEAKNYYDDLAAIRCGMDILSQSAGSFVGKIKEGPYSGNLEDDPIWALWRITGALKELIKLVMEYEEKLPDYHFDPEDYIGFRDNSIYGVIAKGIYKYYDKLSRVEEHDWDMRQTAIDLWMDIYSPSAGPESKVVVEVQKRLEMRLWKQVQKNLEDAHFCYPMITRLLVSINGLHEHSKASEGQKRVSERLLSLLKQKFCSASKIDEKRVRELLPEGYEYDKQKNIIFEHNRWGGQLTILACD